MNKCVLGNQTDLSRSCTGSRERCQVVLSRKHRCKI